MFIKANDGSVLDHSGKVIFFSVERFVKDICEGDCCFICGANPSNVKFNDEHILPDWLLRKYGLFSKKINLPNGTSFRYDQYKVPCCASCNSLMGETFEKPIRELIEGGYLRFTDHIANHGFSFLLNWLALIFFKTHLKDRNLRINRDTRDNYGYIADGYDWQELFHIHCIARSFYTKCELDTTVQGTLLVLPARTADQFELFDYLDLYSAQTMLLRMGDIAILHVLNDSCAVMNWNWSLIQKINQPLSYVQLRELTAAFAHTNTNLIQRPIFHSSFDLKSNTCKVSANIPDELKFSDFNHNEYGAILFQCLKDYLQTISPLDRENVEPQIKKGIYSFVFDKNGNLITRQTG